MSNSFVENQFTPQVTKTEMSPMLQWILGISIMLVTVVVILGGIIWFVSSFHKSPSPVVSQNTPTSLAVYGGEGLSGIVNFNGYADSDSYIAIAVKSSTDSTYSDVVSGLLPTKQNVAWSWNGATFGKTYQIKARLKKRGSVVNESGVFLTSSPNTHIVLNLNSTESPQLPQPATLGGVVALQGYIPPGTTIAINERQSGSIEFTPVGSPIPAINGTSWLWAGAESGKNYDLQYGLYQNGSLISAQQITTFTAPAANEILYLTSLSQPTAPSIVSIAGTIQITGTIPSGSTLSIAQRPTGQGNFTNFVSNLSGADNTQWNWAQAQSGSSYDIQATLSQNGTTIATSQIATLIAPTSGTILTINAPVLPPSPPSNSMTNSCVGQNGNQWQVKLGYNNNSVITNAQQYMVQIGVSTTDSSILNITLSPSNPNGLQNYTTGYVLTNGSTYFARYAYATCTNCNTFSQFSQPVQISCSQ